MLWRDFAHWEPIEHPEAKNLARVSPCGLDVVMLLTQGYATRLWKESWLDVLRDRWSLFVSWTRVDGEKILYAATNSRRANNKAMLHRVLTDFPNDHVGHINMNGLDNRLSNLRVGRESNHRDRQLRSDNKTGYKGVHFDKTKGRFRAGLVRKEKGKSRKKYFGYFDTAEEAALAYDRAVRLLNWFLNEQQYSLNFPRSGELPARS